MTESISINTSGISSNARGRKSVSLFAFLAIALVATGITVAIVSKDAKVAELIESSDRSTAGIIKSTVEANETNKFQYQNFTGIFNHTASSDSFQTIAVNASAYLGIAHSWDEVEPDSPVKVSDTTVFQMSTIITPVASDANITEVKLIGEGGVELRYLDGDFDVQTLSNGQIVVTTPEYDSAFANVPVRSFADKDVHTVVLQVIFDRSVHQGEQGNTLQMGANITADGKELI